MDPVLPGLLLMGGVVTLPGDRSVREAPNDGQWRFPVPRWRDYAPTRSDFYQSAETTAHRAHHGVDIMYKRRPGGADQMWTTSKVNGRVSGSKNYFVPDGIYACAARDGTLWTVGESGHGKFVIIDHGKPYCSFYTHLSSVLFPFLKSGAQGIRVKAGQKIGVIGHNPMDSEGLVHLHFEIWFQGGADSHIDPWPLIKDAPLPE